MANYRSNKRQYNKDEPIVSYGLILFYHDENNNIEFLIQQRRDTFEYMDFIRGLWKNDFQIKLLLSKMTVTERQRIKNYNFQELWDDLFIEKNSKIYRDLHGKAKRKYSIIENSLCKYLKDTASAVESQPWGFPKGKKLNSYEEDIKCAIRETEEETRISRNNFIVYPRYKFEEYYQGGNGKNYGTIYFLAELNHRITPEKIRTPNAIRFETLSEEVQNIRYGSINQSCKILSNSRREELLLKALNTIERNLKC